MLFANVVQHFSTNNVSVSLSSFTTPHVKSLEFSENLKVNLCNFLNCELKEVESKVRSEIIFSPTHSFINHNILHLSIPLGCGLYSPVFGRKAGLRAHRPDRGTGRSKNGTGPHSPRSSHHSLGPAYASVDLPLEDGPERTEYIMWKQKYPHKAKLKGFFASCKEQVELLWPFRAPNSI